jgi:DNA-binding NarL/FixJ family response regulator
LPTLSSHPEALSTLLVAPPGAIEEVIRAVLQSIPEVEVTGYVTGCLSAAHAMRTLAPDLVVISGQIPSEEIIALIRQPANERHAPRIVVLATSYAQLKRLLEAGASAVITPWDSVSQLQKAIAGGSAKGQRADVTWPGEAFRPPSGVSTVA